MKMSYPVLAHQEISAENGMVAAQHPLGAQVGLDVLQRGGNAVDAAVTTAFAMGVLQPLMNGIGGGGVMVVFLDGGGGGTVDYGMQSPGLARPDMYELEDGLVPPSVDSLPAVTPFLLPRRQKQRQRRRPHLHRSPGYRCRPHRGARKVGLDRPRPGHRPRHSTGRRRFRNGPPDGPVAHREPGSSAAVSGNCRYLLPGRLATLARRDVGPEGPRRVVAQDRP